METLPLEVFYQIVDEVSKICNPLAPLATLSRAWQDAVERHTFRTLVVPILNGHGLVSRYLVDNRRRLGCLKTLTWDFSPGQVASWGGQDSIESKLTTLFEFFHTRSPSVRAQSHWSLALLVIIWNLLMCLINDRYLRIRKSYIVSTSTLVTGHPRPVPSDS